ncbi:MAG: hypothetical protein GY749_40125 [Desulfobacteraceae bacterium]|nr:hypothetical protein [Desulfobacteraceae bacterium]
MKKTALITLAVIFTVGTVYAAEQVNISGTVYYNNQPLNAMVLANGQYMFTDTADGTYDFDATRDENGEVTLFVFCDGFDPFRQILELGNTTYTDINMSPVSPDSRTFNMTFSSTPVMTALSEPVRTEWVKISGIASYKRNPLSIMVLANGQHMFTNAEDGLFELEVPLDKDDKVILYGFCDGFAPYRMHVYLGGTKCRPEGFTEAENKKLNSMTAIIPSDVAKEFDSKYTAWKDTWAELAFHSDPRKYAESEQYYDFLEFCRMNSETLPLLFRLFVEDDYYFIIIPIKDMTAERYGFIIDEIRQESLSQECYDENGKYMAPSLEGNGMKYIKRILADLTRCETEEFTEAENDKLNALIADISTETVREFNSKYTAWEDTWPALAFHSNPYMYARSEQYYDFLEFCKMNDETLPLMFRLFAEDDHHYLIVIPIEHLTLERYGFIMDEIIEECLSQKCYDENGEYIPPSQENNWMKYIKRLLAELTKCETEEFTEAENDKLNALIADISTETVREFNSKYTAWEDTWPALAFHSNPRMYAKSEQYYDFLEFCKINDETLPLLFRMFAEDDRYYLIIIPIKDMTAERYGYIMDEVLSQKCYDENGVYIRSSQKGNEMKYIKRLLELLYESHRSISFGIT